jgi:hypothetical protein
MPPRIWGPLDCPPESTEADRITHLEFRASIVANRGLRGEFGGVRASIDYTSGRNPKRPGSDA